MSRREVSQTELAEFLGLTTRQIRNLDAEGLPHRAEGNRKFYPIPEAVEWYYQGKGQPTAIEEAERRKAVADARMSELKVAQLEGKLVPVELHERRVVALLDRIRAPLLNIPGNHAPAVEAARTPAEAQSVLERIRDETMYSLVALAEEIEDDPDFGAEDDGDDGAAAG